MHGGGCLAICGWGGRWKRWRGYDDGAVDGWLGGPSDNTNRKRGLTPRSCCPRPWFLPLAAGVLEECGLQLRKASTTTTPNHPHNTDALNGVKRPGAGGRSTPGAWGKHRITQPRSRRTVGGWRRAADARSASIQGNTPHGGGGSNRRRDGTPVRPWRGDRSIGGAPAGARSFASGRGWRRLERKKGFSEQLGGPPARVLDPSRWKSRRSD